MGWICNLCNKWRTECEQNVFCPRTIIDRYQHILIRNDAGDEVKYFSFASATSAMEEFSQQVLLQENIGKRKILIEKIDKINYENN